MAKKKQPKAKATGGILTWMDPIPEAYIEVPDARIVAIMYPRGKGTIRYQILTNEDLKDLVPKLAAKITKEDPAIKPKESRAFYCHNNMRFNVYCFGCEFMNIYGDCKYRNKKKLKATELKMKNQIKIPEGKKLGRKSIKNPEVKK